MRKWVFLFIILLINISVKAQVRSNLRTKTIQITSLITQLDTLSIVPGSVKVINPVNNVVLSDSTLFEINYAKAQFLWKSTLNINLTINYRVFPILFSKTYYHKDQKLIAQQPINNSRFTYTPPLKSNNLFTLNGLNKSGSISRGIMFGNNQNLSINSNMALQMSGKIANNIEILAAISDDNLPIQPEGNTQQLNEFDRVFIQLKRDSTVLTAGDYELKKPNSYFMNFYKRTQGAMVNHNFSTKGGAKYSTAIAAAVAKGRSARNNFLGIEGNQGPYRLTGNNGETFIIVIAGTERVYIDGILLIRGQDNDYVVDYNTAEIIFTAKQFITQNSRISVEFEYSDKNYSRSLVYLNQQVEIKKAAFRFNYYNEKDNRNQPFLQTLSDTQKQFLAGLGTNVNEAYFPNVQEVDFNPNEILYQKIDLPNGISYYQYATDPLLAKYRVGFSYVGDGKGNYKLNAQSAANGKVYEYIAPINGVLQGNYEPITLLITPKKQQLITFATDYNPEKNTILNAEFALSNNNVNLFTPKNVGNSFGYGLMLKAKNDLPLTKKADNTFLKTTANYEMVTANFKPIERYRAIEFNRDFNLDGLLSPAREHLFTGNMQFYKSQAKNIGYSLNAFIREGNYYGYLHKINANYQTGKYNFLYHGSLLNSNSNLNQGNFYKQYFDINRTVLGLVAGFTLDQQYNKTIDETTQNLNANSFSYVDYKAYLQSKPGDINRFKVDYSYRKDQLPRLTDLIQSSSSQTGNVSVELTKNTNSTLSLIAGYRQTNYKNNFANVSSDQNLLGRIDYNLNALKGFLNTSIYYEIGNGQEPKRDITYLEVLPGQGVYAWIDYNNNGIKELNEFEVSRFPDQAKYIRVFTSTTDFVRTNFTGINQNIRIQPSALLKGKSGLATFVNKFSNQLSYKIDRKILAANGWEKYNPFDTQIEAANLISLTSFFRNTLFFNRNNPVYGIDLNYLADGGKSYLVNGFDTRKRNEIGVRLRSNFFKRININLTVNDGKKRYLSELFTLRNYQISYLEVLPELNYQINNNLRFTVAGSYANQHNENLYGGEKNTNISLTNEARYNILNKGLLTGRLSYINNKFTGNSNSTIGYEMLAGLQTGNNFTWGLGLQRNIGSGIQLNVNYEGRKSTQVSTIHTGNMQVRAYF